VGMNIFLERLGLAELEIRQKGAENEYMAESDGGAQRTNASGRSP
jgi:hypothetical protein